MKLNPTDKKNAAHLTQVFRVAFQQPDVKQATFGPILQHVDGNYLFQYDSNGLCRASSIAFARIMNKGSQDWQLKYIDELWTYGPHHYLYHKPSKMVFDLTFDQFTVDGITQIPYYMGRTVPNSDKDDDMARRFITAIHNSVDDLSRK